MPRLRAAAMKICVRSWHTPRLSANASAARGRHLGGVGVVADLLVQPLEHDVQQPAARCRRRRRGSAAAKAAMVASALVSAVSRKNRVGREPLDRAAHDALGVAGLDLPLDQHAELAERTFGGEGMGDVAERVLVLVEPAIGGHVDAPARHILAVVVARREPQHLDHAGRRRRVAVGGQVRDAKAHCRATEDGRQTAVDKLWGTKSSSLVLPLSVRRRYIRYCSVTAAPSRLLSLTNSSMNSCSPPWKISSMRLFSSRARMARACRWAGPWRP